MVNSDQQSDPILPTKTKNVVIEDPKKREVINNLIAVVGVVLGTAMVVDISSDAFDISAWTEPIFVGYAYIASAFGIFVTRPNYPKF